MPSKIGANTAAEASNMKEARKVLAYQKATAAKAREKNIKSLLSFYNQKSKEADVRTLFKIVQAGLPRADVFASTKKDAEKVARKNGWRNFSIIQPA